MINLLCDIIHNKFKLPSDLVIFVHCPLVQDGIPFLFFQYNTPLIHSSTFFVNTRDHLSETNFHLTFSIVKS